jgi:predicted dehydrogenase
MMARLETKAEIEDVVSVLLRFKSGALGFVTADYISADRFELTISGTKAVARFDLQKGVSILRQGEKSFQSVQVAPNDYLKVQLEEFASCVLHGTRPEIGGGEALLPLAIIHAAIKSNKERRVVSTEEVLSQLSASA